VRRGRTLSDHALSSGKSPRRLRRPRHAACSRAAYPLFARPGVPERWLTHRWKGVRWWGRGGRRRPCLARVSPYPSVTREPPDPYVAASTQSRIRHARCSPPPRRHGRRRRIWSESSRRVQGWTCIRRRWWRRCGAGAGGQRSEATQTFGTTPRRCGATRLVSSARRHARRAGEHGVYWKPVYYALEADVTVGWRMRSTEAGSGPEDRRAGQRVAGAIAGARLIRGVCAAAGDSGAAGAHPGADGLLQDRTRVVIGCTRCWKTRA